MSRWRVWLVRRVIGRNVVILNAVVALDRQGRIVVGSRGPDHGLLVDSQFAPGSQVMLGGFDGPIPMVEASR